jgi:hypothetical protein
VDVLYQDAMVDLPLALAEGDEVRFRCAGAYVSTYSTVGFNGFAPLGSVVHTSTPRSSAADALRAGGADFRGDPGNAS